MIWPSLRSGDNHKGGFAARSESSYGGYDVKMQSLSREQCNRMMKMENKTEIKTEEEIIEELKAARLAHPLNPSDFTEAKLERMKEYAPREVELMEE